MKKTGSFLILLFFLMCSELLIAQRIVQSWTIEEYQIDLVEHIQVSVTPGIRILHQQKENKYRTYVLSKNQKDFDYHQNIIISEDSCQLSFVEYEKPFPTQGVVGYAIEFNLCNKSLKKTNVIKPKWTVGEVNSGIITALDSVCYNHANPHSPYKVPEYNNGKTLPLHHKSIEGLLIFFDTAPLIGPYVPGHFEDKNKPHFEITLLTEKGEVRILTYWERYIVDGYVYGTWGAFGSPPFDIKFWESNIKLLKMR